MDSCSAIIISLLVTSSVFGRPEMISLPLACMVSMISFPFSSTSIHAQPIFIFSSSAVCSPMSSACRFFMYWIIASFSLSPAWRMEVLATMPPKAIIAMRMPIAAYSAPPPISAIMHPVVPSTGSPAPIAAAIGSSRIYTSPAPMPLTT